VSDLEKLAERAEQASGPRPELDATIWLNVVATPEQVKTVEAGRKAHGDTEARFRVERMMDGVRYTASLDAAMTLVPDGWHIDLRDYADSRAPLAGLKQMGVASVKQADLLAVVGSGETLALALAAAALRAHAALRDSGRQPQAENAAGG